jgi:hypothetical protein
MNITSVLTVVVSTFIVAILYIPSVLKIAEIKNVFDSFCEPKVHTPVVGQRKNSIPRKISDTNKIKIKSIMITPPPHIFSIALIFLLYS